MQRPGGRTARVRNAVHEAVIALLAEQSWEELSLPAVAERSGVHQATLYRRWRTVPALLDDVVAEHLTRAAPLPDTGTLRGDLDAYAAGVARGLTGPFRVLILRAAMVDTGGAGTPALSGVLAQRSRQLQEMLDRARDRGEAAPTLDELVELVLAPLYFYALFGRPAGAADPRRLVDRLLELAAAA
ncbi:transcriptional regulator, TetR family [Pseudonocardia ammonioxydans]|uniref:Transcriptional regulator, TetR family n=2 Tax=Pseudonocardia ammonioxydans TaxID=260086 RepID=A0A1I4UNA7_PSUAM|nr:transcriptional regulator, TetR family [Pseudonocardia ammonioxydans]